MQVNSFSYIYLTQLAFDNALTRCVTVSFSVCSLAMLSQIVLQFLFQLVFNHALSSFFCHFAV